MGMSKKDFIALADSIREHNRVLDVRSLAVFRPEHLETLAQFCKRTNSNFKQDRWLDYIGGKCGPNGGNVKETTWDVQGNYGQGWETVCTEDSRKEALQRLKEYRENEPTYSHRIVRA